MRIGDGLTGVLLALLGLAVVFQLRTFPEQAGFFGPSLFPAIVAAGLLICGGLLVLRAARAKESGAYGIELFGALKSRRAGLYVVLMAASIFAYAFLGEAVGFQIITFVTLFVFYVLLRPGIVFPVVTALVLTVAFDLLFREILRVPLPGGLLEGMI